MLLGLLIAILVFLGGGASIPKVQNQAMMPPEPPTVEPLETYVGGACTCPVKNPPVVNLYKSRGDSIDEIKKEEQNTKCPPNQGCSMAREFRLYP